MDLERELRAIAVDWPVTPVFRLALEPRRRRLRVRPVWIVAFAAVVVAVAAAFAVPQSRGAILRFLHLGGEKIEFVDTLPSARERPLGEALGRVITREDAKSLVDVLLLPPAPALPPLHESGGVVSLLVRLRGRTVLLSELPSRGEIFLKKLSGQGTHVRWVRVRHRFGLWLSGERHVFFFPGDPARLAGNALIWSTENTTYRLEGRDLTLEDALAFAGSLRSG